MEIDVVKSFMSDLETACREAEKLGKRQLDLDIFRNTSVKACLVAFLTALPTEITTAIKSSRRHRPDETTSKAKITLSPDIEISLNAWKSAGTSFYTQMDDRFEAYHCPLSGAYIFLTQVERRYAADRIRRRLLYVVFSSIKELFGRTRLRKTTLEKFTQIINKSGLVDASSDVVKERIGTWASRGDKYKLLACDLGGLGSLFLLPDNVGDSFWEQRLAQTGAAREKTIESLKERGIIDEAARIGAHDVANFIVDFAIRKVARQVEGGAWESEDEDTAQNSVTQFQKANLPVPLQLRPTSLHQQQTHADTNRWAKQSDGVNGMEEPRSPRKRPCKPTSTASKRLRVLSHDCSEDGHDLPHSPASDRSVSTTSVTHASPNISDDGEIGPRLQSLNSVNQSASESRAEDDTVPQSREPTPGHRETHRPGIVQFDFQPVQSQHSPNCRQSFSSPQGAQTSTEAPPDLNTGGVYLTESIRTTEFEKELAVPSFNAISGIPSLHPTNRSYSQQATGLPSTPLNLYIPSFSQITGIPSPDSRSYAPSPVI